MKSIILLVGLCLPIISFGQGAKKISTARTKYIKQEEQYIRNILQQQQAKYTRQHQPNANAKTTSTAERVIAYSKYNLTDTLTNFIGKTDSSYFVYSAGRGSTFDFSSLSYGNAWASTGSVAYPYALATGKIAQNGSPGVFSDTTWIFQSAFPIIDTIFLLDERNISYDSNYNVTDYADIFVQDSSGYYFEDRNINSYDAYKNVASSYTLSWDMAAWDTSEYRTFTYNSSHNIVKDSTILYEGGGVFVPEYRWNYIVNSFGKDSIAYMASYDTVLHVWDTTTQQFSYYYPDSLLKLAGYTMLDSVGGHFVNALTDSFKYAAGTSIPSYIKEQLFDVDGAMQEYSIETRHFNSNNLPDTVYYRLYDISNNLIDAWNETILYDAFYDPTQILHYNDNFDSTGVGTFSKNPDSKQFFYYETFTPAPYWISSAPGAAVTALVKGNENIKVYPNPSHDVFTIEYGNIKSNTELNVTDISGRLIYTSKLSTGSGKIEINAAGWMPGVYFYKVYGNESVLGTGKIIKD